MSELESNLGLVDNIANDLTDIAEFYKIASEEEDSDAIKDYFNELSDINQKIDLEIFKLQFNGDKDIKNC